MLRATCATLLCHAASIPALLASARPRAHRPQGVRGVSSEDGAAFARAHGCLFKETSAKTDSGGVDEGVYDALIWGLVCTILDTPGLTRRGGSGAGGGNLDLQAQRGLRKWLGGCC